VIQAGQGEGQPEAEHEQGRIKGDQHQAPGSAPRGRASPPAGADKPRQAGSIGQAFPQASVGAVRPQAAARSNLLWAGRWGPFQACQAASVRLLAQRSRSIPIQHDAAPFDCPVRSGPGPIASTGISDAVPPAGQVKPDRSKRIGAPASAGGLVVGLLPPGLECWRGSPGSSSRGPAGRDGPDARVIRQGLATARPRASGTSFR